MSNEVKKPRPHAELRKLYADDDKLEIEFYGDTSGVWCGVTDPRWYPDTKYRVKPKDPVAKYKIAYETTGSPNSYVTSVFYLSAADFESQHTHLKFKWIEAIHSSQKMFDK